MNTTNYTIQTLSLTTTMNENTCVLIKEGTTVELSTYNNKPKLTIKEVSTTNNTKLYKVCTRDVESPILDTILIITIVFTIFMYIQLFFKTRKR